MPNISQKLCSCTWLPLPLSVTGFVAFNFPFFSSAKPVLDLDLLQSFFSSLSYWGWFLLLVSNTFFHQASCAEMCEAWQGGAGGTGEYGECMCTFFGCNGFLVGLYSSNGAWDHDHWCSNDEDDGFSKNN